ncbi:MAG: hypothetical protein IPM25_07705 [Chloracidobacterium sp.]|nr:hypothetical protein [Chloracidobacterium sp.]
MLRYSSFLTLSLWCCIAAVGQASSGAGASGDKNFAAEARLAELTVAAHGGQKFREMQSLVVSGSVEITTSAFPQAIPASFVTIFAGEKYRLEINNPFQPLKQAYDGTQTVSSLPGGFTLPPINRLGLPILQQLGKQGFIVTPLPEEKKKKRGFRMTSPEGFFTDFYLEDKTDKIRSYDATYVMSGRTVTTSVEIDKLRLVDGVLLPEKYAQRFNTEQFTVYASFKAKDIVVNSAVKDTVFKTLE